MTLQEAKDKTAQNANFSNWQAMLDYPAYQDRKMVELRMDEAAELYCKTESQYWRNRYDSTQSMMDSRHRVGEDGWR